jgi:hypothetical protein
MSIAILPMSAEFNWSPATVGLIQSSFFWGYLLTQVSFSIKLLFYDCEHLAIKSMLPWYHHYAELAIVHSKSIFIRSLLQTPLPMLLTDAY